MRERPEAVKQLCLISLLTIPFLLLLAAAFWLSAQDPPSSLSERGRDTFVGTQATRS
jgi:hypothetical protein